MLSLKYKLLKLIKIKLKFMLNELIAKNNKVYKIGDVFATQGMKKTPLKITKIIWFSEETNVYCVELIGIRGGLKTCFYNKALNKYTFSNY
jgi:hypothetical protein